MSFVMTELISQLLHAFLRLSRHLCFL